ncbi:MAG: hypothetical protein OXI67_02270 [Candidatus Poribacteria bacterium]|nr:hypothetical protein [Candidatus Poribacteria bacterium]
MVTLLALVNIVYVGILCRNLNTELDEFDAFIDKVEKNSVILPLQLNRPANHSESVFFSTGQITTVLITGVSTPVTKKCSLAIFLFALNQILRHRQMKRVGANCPLAIRKD